MSTATRVLIRARKVLSPRVVLSVSLVYLAVTLVAIYAVDVRDVFGLRTTMLALDMNRPGLWFQLYGSRKLTEVFQWVLLAAATPLAGVLGGRLIARGQYGPGAFWSLTSVALAYMLMEDAGNVRDILAAYVVDLYPQYELLATFGFRLLIFGAVAILAIYALVKHGSSVWQVAPARPYLATAYAVLGVGVISDLSAVVGLYEVVGLFVHNTLAGGQMAIFPGETLASQAGMFMDSVWEEALEVVGYASFLASALAYWNAEISDPHGGPYPG